MDGHTTTASTPLAWRRAVNLVKEEEIKTKKLDTPRSNVKQSGVRKSVLEDREREGLFKDL